jgi:hypothetical protein
MFTEALKRPVAERGAFLDQACAGDAELRRKVEELLRAYERLGDFLETGPLQSADENNDEGPPKPNVDNGDSDAK